MHLLVLRELAEMIAELLSIITERSWRLREVSEDWWKANVTSLFKKGKVELGNYKLANLTSVPGKVMEQIILVIYPSKWKRRKL